MQQEGLKARIRKRYRVTTMSDHDQPVAPNLLDRQFTEERPNQRWVGDTTELVTGNGKLFLAVILGGCVRLHPGLLQSAASPLGHRLQEPAEYERAAQAVLVA